MRRCAIYEIAKLIGKKWTLIIIFEIYREGNPSFNQLKRRVKYITPKMLSQRLAELEKKKIVCRTKERSPPRSYFSLTTRGEDLVEIFDVMKEWHKKWVGKGTCPSSCRECDF